MNYKSVSMFDLNPMDLTNVVHPMYQNLYLRKLKRIKYLEVHHVLVIEQLSKNDGIFDDFGEVRKDVPFSLRCHINNILKRGNFHRGKLATMGGGRTRSVEIEPPKKELSEYEQIPPLSASVVEYEKTHGITKKTIHVASPTIEKMITNPELDGISSVNIDPVSMAVETVIDLIEGGKEFIANPSLGGVAAMAVTAIPGKVADKFSVGAYDKIKGTVPNMDAHHVGQKALMNKFIPNYDLNKAPAILVPKVGHTLKGPNGIVSRKTTGIDTARGLIARDIKELRRVYPDIPNSQLKKLVDMNKELYPDAFVKRK